MTWSVPSMYASASALAPVKSSVPGNDGGLDIAIAVQHVMKNLLQPGQWRLAGNVIGRTDFLFRNQSEGSAHGFRRVVEGRLQRDFRVVQPVGVELHLGAGGAAAKEVHRPALTHHV